MTDPDALGAVALYNPQLLGEQELRRHFVARGEDLRELLDELTSRREATPQHRLVFGQRGMGKTTLLHRIASAVDEDDLLGETYIPLLFPEEQYNIRHLGDLWLNSLDALADVLDRRGDTEGAAEIDEIIEDLPLDDEPRLEEKARLALLAQAQRRGRRLLLLLDNADMIFERVDTGDWTLRKALQAHPELVVVAASTSAGSTFQYEAAFFDFFATMRLSGLHRAEAYDLLLKLAADRNNEQVARLVREHPERIEPIRLLLDGNPRALVALYDVLEGSRGDVRSDLSVLLDRYTPLYKSQFDSLSPQAQTIVDALCRHWDPATAAALADRTGHGVNKVSAQLDRLVSAGMVSKGSAVDHRGAKRRRNAFHITERLFNIWYLMRGSRRDRRRLEDLVLVLSAIVRSPEPPVSSFDEAAEADDLEPYVGGLLAAIPHRVRASDPSNVRDDLEQVGLADRLRPAHAALHAWALDEPGFLDALAPEVARASRLLLERWTD